MSTYAHFCSWQCAIVEISAASLAGRSSVSVWHGTSSFKRRTCSVTNAPLKWNLFFGLTQP